MSSLFLLLASFGCRSTTVPMSEQGELQGKVYLLGNDPFTQLALQLDERNYVVLLCSPEVDKYLRGHQGELAQVSYEGTSQVPEGRAVRVKLAEIVKQ
jgi:hypothetical protein